jgi:hypothetical protein
MGGDVGKEGGGRDFWYRMQFAVAINENGVVPRDPA